MLSALEHTSYAETMNPNRLNTNQICYSICNFDPPIHISICFYLVSIKRDLHPKVFRPSAIINIIEKQI